MMQPAEAYTVSMDEDQVAVRIDRNLFSSETVTRFLDWLRLESIRQRSQATQEDIDTLAEEVDRAAWAKIKERLLLPSSPYCSTLSVAF